MRERTILKIGEFARVDQVSIATLRHYDQYGLTNISVVSTEEMRCRWFVVRL